MGTYYACNTNGIENVPYQASVRISLNNIQNVPASAWTTINWDTENYDTQNMWDSSNPTFITIPETGTYLIIAQIVFASNMTGDRTIRVTLNGVTTLCFYNTPAVGGGVVTSVKTSTIERLSGGSVIEVQVFQTSGVALTTNSGREFCYCCVHKIA